MLDDMNVLAQRDSQKTLDSSAIQYQQLSMELEVSNPDHDGRELTSIVFAGMGGSSLAPELVKAWADKRIKVPFEVVKSYDLPNYVDQHTLVFASSCSGNTEETLEALRQAREKGAEVAIITGGGKLAEQAAEHNITSIILPPIHIQPRMLTFIQIRALVTLLGVFGLVDRIELLGEIAMAQDWLEDHCKTWRKEVPTDKNYAKQLALMAVGKNGIFYGGELTKPVAYKWKISWNESAKNVAFYSQMPESNHNEFIGWTSHPVEKPFAVFDVVSNLEHPRILKRFEISDRLLSGMRPKAVRIDLAGDTLLEQLLWGHLLADYTSIYLGILNGADPGPVKLVEKLKQEMI